MRAKAFYGTIAGATAIGGLLNFTPLDPIKALFWSAVINGVVAVPVMVMIMLMAAKPAIMGQFVLPFRLKVDGLAGDRGDGRGGDRDVRHLGGRRLRISGA
jgi:Mn2+/Fe2+ NRAMP family transporter